MASENHVDHTTFCNRKTHQCMFDCTYRNKCIVVMLAFVVFKTASFLPDALIICSIVRVFMICLHIIHRSNHERDYYTSLILSHLISTLTFLLSTTNTNIQTHKKSQSSLPQQRMTDKQRHINITANETSSFGVIIPHHPNTRITIIMRNS